MKKKRNSTLIKHVILFVAVILCCIFAPGCSPAKAATAAPLKTQPVTAEKPSKPAPPTELSPPVVDVDVVVVTLPEFIQELKRLEKLTEATDTLAVEAEACGSSAAVLLRRAATQAEVELAKKERQLTAEDDALWRHFSRSYSQRHQIVASR